MGRGARVGEGVRGDTSGIEGKRGGMYDSERLLVGRGGEGKVRSLITIEMFEPAAPVFTWRSRAAFGVAGGGRTGLGSGGEWACAASMREERLSR